MEINVFAEKVKSCVWKRLGSELKISIRRANKNNGVCYTGLQITEDKVIISPVIYIDRHYAMYEKGETTIKDTAEYVMKKYKERRVSTVVDMRWFLDYENVRKGIVYKIINTERNKELLEDIPHIEFLDLSIVFQFLFTKEESGFASILVHNAHMKLWDVSVEMLYREAQENTPKILEYEIENMNDVIYEIMTQEEPQNFDHDEYMAELESSIPLYVLSNKDKMNGAACMMYPDIIKDFADRMESSVYIIPSSIHEVLLLPVMNGDRSDDIKNMIREINDTQVEPEEILSYSLYYYNRECDNISTI